MIRHETKKLSTIYWVFIVAVAMWTSGAASQTEKQAIESTIRSQLAAFQADDEHAAYAFASEAIKKNFPDAKQFMQMVKTGYLPVYRPQSVQFASYLAYHTPPIQHVIIIGPYGRAWDAYYIMSKAAGASWKVGGVTLYPRDESVI